MRISDWSSDVCSSDSLVIVQITLRRGRSDAMKRDLYARIAANLGQAAGIRPQDVFVYLGENDFSDWSVGGGRMSMEIAMRSEEHTSELQSLMRISYAVFCLKTKTETTRKH